MTDVTAAQTGGFSLPGIGNLADLAKRGDLALALGVLTILMVLILPLPAVLLYFFLALSLLFSVLILFVGPFFHSPLVVLSFPNLFVFSTLRRLWLYLYS